MLSPRNPWSRVSWTSMQTRLAELEKRVDTLEDLAMTKGTPVPGCWISVFAVVLFVLAYFVMGAWLSIGEILDQLEALK